MKQTEEGLLFNYDSGFNRDIRELSWDTFSFSVILVVGVCE